MTLGRFGHSVVINNIDSALEFRCTKRAVFYAKCDWVGTLRNQTTGAVDAGRVKLHELVIGPAEPCRIDGLPNVWM